MPHYCADNAALTGLAPAELRDPVIDALNRNPGVALLVVHRDAALAPKGDEITADIARESANEVIDALKALGIKERGAITLDVVDTVLSTRAYRAEERAAGDPADAVVWDELVTRTREESTLNVTFITFLCLACLIAAVGVVTDSPVTVVGAMVVGPNSARWAALAVGLVRRRAIPRSPRGARLAVGFPVAMLVTRWACSQARRPVGSTSPARVSCTKWTSSFGLARCRSSSRCSRGRPECCRWCQRSQRPLVGVFISVTTDPAAGFAWSLPRWATGTSRRGRRPNWSSPGGNRGGRNCGSVTAADRRSSPLARSRLTLQCGPSAL